MSAAILAEAVSAFVFDTDDPDRASDYISTAFTEHRPDQRPANDGFHYRHESTTAGELSVNVGRYATSVRATNAPIDHFAVFTVLQGQLEATVGDEQVRLGAGDVALYRTDDTLRTYWSDLVTVFLRLPMDNVARVAAETYGIRAGDFRVESMSPISPVTARLWHDLSSWVTRTIQVDDSPLENALLLAEVTRTLTVAALTVFPTTAMTAGPVRAAGRVEPAALRRAVDYIENHAHEVVTVSEIAEASGLGVRGLQEAFRRHFDRTPMGFLRQVRLERAHHDLQAGDPTRGATVAEIAARWGFRHGGHFAELYRDQYGYSPRRTLAQ